MDKKDTGKVPFHRKSRSIDQLSKFSLEKSRSHTALRVVNKRAGWFSAGASTAKNKQTRQTSTDHQIIEEALRDDLRNNATCLHMPYLLVANILVRSCVDNFKRCTRQMETLKQALSEMQRDYALVLRQSEEMGIFGGESLLIPPDLIHEEILGSNHVKRRRHFEARRQELSRKLFVTHSLARLALSRSYEVFPEFVVCLDAERIATQHHIAQFIKDFRGDADMSAAVLQEVWFAKLVKGAQKSLGVTQDEKVRLLRCLECLVTVQVRDLQRRSIAHVLETFSRGTKLPRFCLSAELLPNGTLALSPSEDELMSALHLLLNTICNAGQKLPHLGGQEGYIATNMHPDFLRQAHKQLSQIFSRQFTDLRKHLTNLGERFGALYAENSHQEQAKILTTMTDFDVLSRRVHHWREFLLLALAEPTDICFPIARLDMNNLMSELQRRARALTQGVLSIMESIHQADCQSICAQFLEIERRAETPPVSTEELMNTGEFLAHAENTLLFMLEEKIQKAAHQLAFIMRLRYLSSSHSQLATDTLQWLSKIQPTFSKSVSIYEGQRAHFERCLQQRTDQLNHDLEDTMPKMGIINSMRDLEKVKEYLEEARLLQRRISEFEEEAAWINSEEQLFKFPLSTYPELDELKNMVVPVRRLLRLCDSWQMTLNKWMDGAFDDLHAGTIDIKTSQVLKETEDTLVQFRAIIKQQITDNNPRRLKGVLDDPDPSNLPAPLLLCHQMLLQLRAFRTQTGVVRVLCNPSLRPRHWTEMSGLIGSDVDITPDAGSSLRKMLALNLSPEMLQRFKVISEGASRELALSDELLKMQVGWKDVNFELEYDSIRDCFVLCKLLELQATLTEQLLRTQAMRGSAFAKPHAVALREWNTCLRRTAATVQTWGQVQMQWIVLAPLFACLDIQQLLPQEFVLFTNVDKLFRATMSAVVENANVLKHASCQEVLEQFQDSVKKLDSVRVGMTRYIDLKRTLCPRFYFLSNEEVLSLVSDSLDPEKASKHLRKCFPGAVKVTWDSSGHLKELEGKARGQRLEILQPLPKWRTQEKIEILIKLVEEAMISSMRTHLASSLKLHKTGHVSNRFPVQLAQVASRIAWTANVEASFKNPIKKPLDKIIFSLQAEEESLCAKLASCMQMEERQNQEAIAATLIHFNEVTKQLKENCVQNNLHFIWLSQLRFYMNETELRGSLLYATLDYGCEFLGRPMSNFVMTEQAAITLRTLISSYNLSVGCCLQGGPGSGKSAAVTWLAETMGKLCVSFVCSSFTPHQAIARVLLGAAGTGAWLIIEATERLSEDNLSVISQHMRDISRALDKQRAGKLHLRGHDPLDIPPVQCLVCLTSGLEGSRHLPPSLRALFRPVCCNDGLIQIEAVAKVLLKIKGFHHTALLACQLAALFELVTTILEPHPKPGLNSAIRVIETAAKRIWVRQSASENHGPQDEEQEVAILSSSARDLILPSLEPQYHATFTALLAQVFGRAPFVPQLEVLPDKLFNVIKKECESEYLEASEYFLGRCLELYNLLQSYRGVIILGNAGAGKTTILKVLQQALRKLGKNEMKFETVYPIALSDRQLFGHFEPETANFEDGIITRYLRAFASHPGTSWLVLDGPLMGWAETLHSALDQDSKLVLSCGEVIHLSRDTSVVFETDDLSQISPGTAWRCGILRLDTKILGWEVLVQSWLRSQQAKDVLWATAEGELLMTLLRWLVPPCQMFLTSHATLVVNIGINQLVRTTCDLIEMLLRAACCDPEASKHVRAWLQAATMLAMAWAFGGPLDARSKETFDDMYKAIWKGMDSKYPYPNSLDGKIDVAIPGDGQLTEHAFTFKFKGTWKAWHDSLRSLKMTESANLYELVVPTVDMVRYEWLLLHHIEAGLPVLLMGGKDVGKSTLVKYLLLEKLPPQYQPAILRLTHHTSAHDLQEEICGHLSKRAGGSLGPSMDGQSCVMFVDDIAEPRPDEGGVRITHELLRQILDHKDWFEPGDGGRVVLESLLLLGALFPRYGPQGRVSPRLLRHFSIFSLNPLTEDTMARIFTTILNFAFKNNGFASDVGSVTNAMIQSSLEAVKSLQKLKINDASSSISLGFRDVQRLIFGCAQIRKENADNKRVMVRLWTHETMRVLGDRLESSEFKEKLLQLVLKAVKENFKEQLSAVFEHLPRPRDEQVSEETMDALVFGKVTSASNGNGESQRYVELNAGAYKKVKEQLQATVLNMNEGLILFPLAERLACRVARVLTQPRGSTILFGALGRGRRSIARVAAKFCGFPVLEPCQPPPAYTVSLWREDLCTALKTAGCEGRDVVFVLREHVGRGPLARQILHDVDCQLKQGCLQGLFSAEQKQDITEAVMLEAQGGCRTVELSPMAVFNFFASRCQDRLHWILCLDPLEPDIKDNLKDFPALMDHVTPIIFPEWPEDALKQITEKHAESLELEPEVRELALSACRYYHRTAKALSARYFQEQGRHIEICPSTLTDQLRLLRELSTSRQELTRKHRQRYVVGLEKLQLAATQVKRIQEELGQLQPRLAEAAEETNSMMEVIDTETHKVSEASLLVRRDEAVANAQAAAAQELKSECETELAQAIPILEDAVAALNTLKPTDITLVKSMKNPPEPIKLVLAAVCVIRNIKPDRLNDAATGRKIIDYWGPSKKLLGDIAFLQQLRDFDKDNIPPVIIAKIRKEFLPHPDFRPEVVANASSAAEGLCKWVRAMDMYDAVAKEVAPKKVKLEEAQREYAVTLAVLEEKRAQVRKLERQLAELQTQFQAANSHKLQLEAQFSACAHKLARAEKLIGGLGGEKDRWAATAHALQKDLDTLLGDVLLASAVLTYLGPFAHSYRASCLAEWQEYAKTLGLPCSQNFDFYRVMSSELQTERWYLAGLPRDLASSLAAIIVHRLNKKPCLMIDPQRQAVTWVRNLLAGHLREVHYPSPDFGELLQEYCTQGRPVLVPEITEANVTPLLADLKKYIRVPFSQGNMKEGKNEMENQDGEEDYQDFRIYLACALPAPRLAPETFGEVTVVELTLPPEGLQDQLSDIIMAAEKPALRLARQQVVSEGARNKAAQQEVEERILTTLSETRGNILEDVAAVEVLDTAKTLSEELAERQARSQRTVQEIADFQRQHGALARDVAAVFTTLAALSRLHFSYQFPLSWFLDHFSASIRHSSRMANPGDPAMVVGERQQQLFAGFVRSLCSQLELALLQKHRPAFRLLLCLNLLRARGEMTEEELDFLLKLGDSLEDASDEYFDFEQFGEFNECLEYLRGHRAKWEGNIATYKLPERWGKPEREHLRRLLLAAALTPLDVRAQAESLVSATLDLTPPPSWGSLQAALALSTYATPLVCVLGQGAHLSAQLDPLARDAERTTVEHFSLARDQRSEMKNILASARKQGTWVCFYDCHLLSESDWQLLEGNHDEVNSSFRLWIVCTSNQHIASLGLLQRSVKLALENPESLRGVAVNSIGLQACRMEECGGREATFCRLAFGLAVFHALLLTRARLQATTQGVPEDSDLDLASRHLWNLCSTLRRIPLEIAITLIGECCYGARVASPWERRSRRRLLELCLCEELLRIPGYPLMADVFPPGLPSPCPPVLSTCMIVVQDFPLLATPEVCGERPISSQVLALTASRELIEFIRDMLKPPGRQKRSAKPDDMSLEEQVVYILDQLSSLSKEENGCESRTPNEVIASEEDKNSIADNEANQMTTRALNKDIDFAPAREEIGEAPFSMKSSKVATEGILSVVLIAEKQILAQSLALIQDDLKSLLRDLKTGKSVVDHLAGVASEIVQGFALFAWKMSVQHPPTSLPSVLLARHMTLQAWESGKAINLSLIERPKALLVALRYFHMQSCGCQMLAGVYLFLDVFSDNEDLKLCSMMIDGLVLDGALWNPNKGTLEVPPSDFKPRTLPPLLLRAGCTSEMHAEAHLAYYFCPLYTHNNNRDEDFLAAVMMRSGKQPPEYWARASVALFLSE